MGTALLFVLGFGGLLLSLYMVVKTATVAVLDAINYRKERNTKDGKET